MLGIFLKLYKKSIKSDQILQISNYEGHIWLIGNFPPFWQFHVLSTGYEYDIDFLKDFMLLLIIVLCLIKSFKTSSCFVLQVWAKSWKISS